MRNPAQPEVLAVSDLFTDLARTHRTATRTVSGGAQADEEMIALENNGYVVLPNVLSRDDIDRMKRALLPLLTSTGRNAFEGYRTQRAYSLLAKTRAADCLIDHPRAVTLVDRLLLRNYQLSQFSAINILPGEDAQLPHADDIFYPIPRPRPALSVATVWAIDDFTEHNGSTVVFPGSHLWPDGREPHENDRPVSLTMTAGSCALFLGTLWHGGGANTATTSRLAITTQYCEPWVRPLEAFTLSVERAIARRLTKEVQNLIGYSVFPPFVGSVDGMHPSRLLERGEP